MLDEVEASDLREHLVAVGVEHTHLVLHATGIDGTFHDVCPFVRERVIDDDRRAFRLGIHHLNGSTGTCRELLSEDTIGDIRLVIRIVIGRENARASQSVVMLLPKHPHPSIPELL